MLLGFNMHRTCLDQAALNAVHMHVLRIELFDINSPLLPAGWGKKVHCAICLGQLEMSHCIPVENYSSWTALQRKQNCK